MSKEASFDIVSSVDLQEIDNAVNQTVKELETRFDFKNSKSSVHFDKKTGIVMTSDSEHKMASVYDILQSKCVKRGVSLKALTLGKIEQASGGTVRQVVQIQEGIEQEAAKSIMKIIKDGKLKVQASIQGEQLRVTGKNRDDLQDVMQRIREANLPIAVQFVNFR